MENKNRRFVITANYIAEVQKKQKATKKELQDLADRINKMYENFLIELQKIK